MKKLLLPLLLLLLSSVKMYAIIITPFVTQTQYRWRNNDGNEATATWRAPVNTAITVSDTSTVLRVRIELNNNSGGGAYDINETLEYSSNGGTSWTSITNAPTNAFKYVSSTFVTNGGATTNQMGAVTPATFVAGRIISAVPAATPLSLNANKTEFEWVIQPTANILPLTTYTFRSANQGSTPVVYPTLNTTCVGAYITSKTDSARCGPGEIQLKAVASPGTTIKWYSTASSTTVLGTGGTFTIPFLAATTTYFAAASVGTTCEGPRVAVTATINPVPVVNLGNDVTVCLGNSATFNAGTFNAYLWDNGATTATRTVNVAGTYYVTVTGPGGCKGRDTVKLLNYPKPVVHLGNDTFICPGVTITLNAGNPGMKYLWDNGTTAQNRNVNTTGTYSVTVTNEFDCSTTDDINVTIKDVPLGNINAVHGNPATYTFTVLNPQFAVGYTWDFGDGSPLASGLMVQHTYTTNGIYTVHLTLEGDCGTNTSKSRTVDVFDAGGTTNINTLSADDNFTIYPNPAKDVLAIETRSGLELQSVELYNIMGQKLKAENVLQAEKCTMNVGGLAAGIYSLKIATNKGTIIRKVEILK